MVGLDREWGESVLKAIHHIADDEFQRRSWCGVGPEASSPTELYCEIFDDNQFERFIFNPPRYLTTTTLEVMDSLVAEMRSIPKSKINDATPLGLIEDPSWNKVRAVAARAAVQLARDLKSA